jgi:hypothetical protein
MIEAQRKVEEDRLNTEIARREDAWAREKAEWESRWCNLTSMMTPSTSTPTASQDTLAPVIGDAPRQLVGSSVGSDPNIIYHQLLFTFHMLLNAIFLDMILSCCLLTLFILSFVGVAV